MGGTLNKSLNPKATMTRWGQRLGHVVGASVGGGGGGGGGGDSDHDSPPPLGTMTIDRVVEQLFFVRISVYNAKGNLTEPQQVGGRCIGGTFPAV